MNMINETDSSVSIGSVKLSGRTVLAPLAGVTNQPFRRMVKRFGCSLVCSEMVSANGLAYGSEKTRNLMACAADEAPVSIQIFGSDPGRMEAAAEAAVAAGADIVDINFGCSVRKVLKTGAGSALMKDIALAGRVIAAVRKTVSVPVTIKMRSGWDPSGDTAMALGLAAQAEGANAVTLHPRTASQGFGGHADWRLIRRLKETLSIPVIGNGDVRTPEDACRMIRETGCDAVMIGRAAMGDPALFMKVEAVLGGVPVPLVTVPDRFSAMRIFAAEMAEAYGEAKAGFMLRSRLGWLVKGLHGSSRFREQLNRLVRIADICDEIDRYEAFLCEGREVAGGDAGL